jgi:hypothetical protein
MDGIGDHRAKPAKSSLEGQIPCLMSYSEDRSMNKKKWV